MRAASLDEGPASSNLNPSQTLLSMFTIHRDWDQRGEQMFPSVLQDLFFLGDERTYQLHEEAKIERQDQHP
jgi:hypothetical protein